MQRSYERHLNEAVSKILFISVRDIEEMLVFTKCVGRSYVAVGIIAGLSHRGRSQLGTIYLVLRPCLLSLGLGNISVYPLKGCV